MADKSDHPSSIKVLTTFVKRFFHYCYVVRGTLGAHVAVVMLGGVSFAHVESIRPMQGIYFALITSTTVGYGDITPKTGAGQCISVGLALIGTVFFGLIVAIATQAFSAIIREFAHHYGITLPSEK